MSAPFVGRRREIAEVTSLLRSSSRDRAPAAALITGEPGSGKTRLLGEILAAPGSARPVRVVGFEPNQGVPLAAVGEVIRQLATVPVHGMILDALVFGDAGRASRAPLRIFEAAHRALMGYGPLFVVIDDLQWVDDQSLGLIHYLLRASEPARQPLTVVAASRPSSAAGALRSTIDGALSPGRRAFVELGPLPLEDGLSLARSIDAQLSEATGRAIWRRSGGSPFWLEALTRSGHDVEPASLVEDRLRALSTESGALLAALAVGARPFLVDEVAEVLEWPAERVRHAFRELVGRGLGVEVGGTVRLSHDLIREAASAGLPASARRRLEARFADWIEAGAGDDIGMLREALDHRAAAGQSTVGLAVRLLSSPGRRLLNADDLRRLAAISDGLAPAASERIQIDRALAELGNAMGEVDLAIERWTRVSEQAADPSDRREAATEAALAAYRFGRRAEAHELLTRARALPAAKPETEVRLDALQADIELWLDHETAAGSRSAERAVHRAAAMASVGGLEGLSHPARRAYLAALEVAIDGAMQEERDERIGSLAEECVRVAASLDDELRIAAQVRAAMALRTVFRIREAEALGQQAWDASKRLVLPMLTVEAGRGLARVLRDLGRLAEAHAVAIETRSLEARMTDAPRHWGSAASMRHMVELSFADSTAALGELRRDAAAEPDPHYRQDLHLAIATWQARVAGAGAADEVMSELAAARADADLARCPRHSVALALATAELHARVGRVEMAREALAAWDRLPFTGRLGRDVWRLRTVAAIAAAAGDDATAISALTTFARLLETSGHDLELIWARIDIARSLANVDRGLAVTMYSSAAELAERCGATSEGRVVAQGLRRLGVRAWRRGASSAGAGLQGLSDREREVAALVADGRSNREIAEALVVAPKTVERHVTNVLAKLGLRNRTELATMIRSGVVRESPDDFGSPSHLASKSNGSARIRRSR